MCFSLLDRRAAEDMTAFCLEHGVRLLAYGTLAGGLLSEKWLGKPEPAASDIGDWSTMKYKRFVDQIGGWQVLQRLLRARRNRAQTWRIDFQCRHPLGAGAAGGRGESSSARGSASASIAPTICGSSASHSIATIMGGSMRR